MAAISFTASKLIIAIRAGLLGDVVNAIEEGANIEEPDMHGYVGLPLRTACFEGNIDIVRELLRRGANINADAGDGPGAPLRLAKRRGHQSIAALLLLQGAQMPGSTASQTEVNATSVDLSPAVVPAQTTDNTIEFDSPPPDHLREKLEPPIDILLETDTHLEEAVIASPSEATSIALPEGQPDNVIEFTSPSPAEPIETEDEPLVPTLETPVGNIIEFTSPPPELLTEEIEGKTCYGTDTNLLTLDLMRLEEHDDEELPAPENKKTGFWKSGK
jgi:uncharacterized protein